MRTLTVLVMSVVAVIAADPIIIEIPAQKLDRSFVPVSMELPKEFEKAKAISLTSVQSNMAVPCQIDGGRLFWMIDYHPENSPWRYTLAEAPKAEEDRVTAKLSDEDLTFAITTNPILRYQYKVMPSADPGKSFYSRSGFIHPIYDPKGRTLTEAMPADHMHQHGIMFAWVNTEFEGRKVDFWNSHKQQGEVRHAKLESLVSGPIFAGFTAKLEHMDLTAPGGPKVAMNETWEVRVYDRTKGYLIDWKSTMTCASDSPLTLKKNDYGGLCVRGNAAWLEKGVGEFLTSEGKTRLDGNHTRPNWVDISGKLDDGIGGITTFCNPNNFRFPQPVRLHPTMPYMSVSPVVLGSFTIEPAKPYVSQYRFFAHDGKPDAKAIERLWQDYANPIVVRIVK